jgi:hypothetical protein
MTSIDLAPVIDGIVLPCLTAIIPIIGAALAAWLSAKLAAWLHLKSQDKLRDILLNVIDNGLSAATNRAAALPLTIDVHNQKVADATQYVISHSPDAVKKLGLTPDAVRDMIVARLPPPAAQAANPPQQGT